METIKYTMGFFAVLAVIVGIVAGCIMFVNWLDDYQERNDTKKCERIAGNGGYGDWRIVRNNLSDYTCYIMVEPGKYVPVEQLREYGVDG